MNGAGAGAIGLAAAFYTALGCIITYKLLRRYFSVKVSYFTVLTLLLGTNAGFAALPRTAVGRYVFNGRARGSADA